MATEKLLIVQPKVGKNQLNKFIKNLEDEGVKHIYADPKLITDKKSKMKTEMYGHKNLSHLDRGTLDKV